MATAELKAVKNGRWVAVSSDNPVPVLLYDAQGNPLLTAENPGRVDVVDRAARELGKVTAELTGSNVTKAEPVISNITVGAGAYISAGNIIVQGYRRFSLVTIDQSGIDHLHKIGYVGKGETVQFGKTIIYGATENYRSVFISGDVIAPKAYVWINNQDTISHTYNVNAYLFSH